MHYIRFGTGELADLLLLQEIELFMNEADKRNSTFFPKLVPSQLSHSAWRGGVDV
jgi:hypothetical protein